MPEMSDGRQALPVKRAQLGEITPYTDRQKTITLYVNGDQHFFGKSMIVNRRFTQTWDTFLRQATEATGMMNAAREISTPTHGTKVNRLDELKDGFSYVVIAKGTFKPLGYVILDARVL